MSEEIIMDRDYFIAKFEAIPDELWWTGSYYGPDGSHCALGHCGPGSIEESALRTLLDGVKADLPKWPGGPVNGGGPAIINDGRSSRYQQATPKARILAALRDLPDKK